MVLSLHSRRFALVAQVLHSAHLHLRPHFLEAAVPDVHETLLRPSAALPAVLA